MTDTEPYFVKVIQEQEEQMVWQAFFVSPWRISKNSIETVIGLFDSKKSSFQCFTYILCCSNDIIPMAPLRHLNAVLFWRFCHFFVAIELHGFFKFFIINITNSLKEEYGKDVRLVVRRINWACNDMCRFP